MHLLINNIATDVKSGKTFDDLCDYDDILDGYRCAFRAVRREHYKDLFGWAISHYRGTDFPALQCVWPDRNQQFPWASGASREFREGQPTYFTETTTQH